MNHLHQRRDLLHGLQPRLERLLLLLLLLVLLVIILVVTAAVAAVGEAEAALVVMRSSALGRVLMGGFKFIRINLIIKNLSTFLI